MDGGADENTDGTSIVSFCTSDGANQANFAVFQKPVSSLRSHFEGLKSIPASDQAAKEHKTQQIGNRLETPQVGSTARTCLDLPRPESPWNIARGGMAPRTPQGSLSRSESPSKGCHKRPMSMQIGSSPQLTPSVMVESPRSPPKGYFFNRGKSRSPERSPTNTTLNKVQGLVSQQSSRSSTRPSTPKSETGDKATHQETKAGHIRHDGLVAHNEGADKIPAIPPPTRVGEKPKIPAKPAPLTAQDLGSLLPERRKMSVEKRVSPFSTPPSSEGSPSPHESADDVTSQARSQVPVRKTEQQKSGIAHDRVKPEMQPKVDARLIGFSQPKTVIERRDPRNLGFSASEAKHEVKADTALPVRANTVSTRPIARDPSHEVPKSSQRHASESLRSLPPPTQPENAQASRKAASRDPRLLGFSGLAPPNTSIEESRPGLPPRRGVVEPPPRPPDGSKPSTSVHHSHVHPSASSGRTVIPTKSLQTVTSNPALEPRSHFPPPPKRHTTSEIESPLPPDRTNANATVPRPTASGPSARQLPTRLVEEDSDEAEGDMEEPPAIRTEYPNASQANRRPPFFHSGLQDLSIKSDARSFDVCGQYLCTTGFTTRVFDLTSGKQLMEFSHGETVKIVSVAFKPGQELKSEGSRIWFGNNIGELHEIDVATQGLVASNSSHNRREIVRILRHKKDLWTLDDEGKLFVWHADESGTPSLKYSHQAHRVPRGHTFSIVIRDKLWLASGKEIRVFKPGSESSFTILEAPLVQPGVGDVTSGSYTTQQGGRVYFGHNDGKVTIYSIKDYACLGNVKVSDYKINGLTFAGDYLWAAYRTGKIYVYDTSTTPWTVKKDWRAHEEQVAGLILDPSSIWTLRRLQVTSIGHDQSIRLWDGMLEDDWLENAMHEADVEYCTFHEIKAAVVTWNVGASDPLEVPGDFICDAIHVDDPPELLVFGFQEVVDLEDRAVTAKSILGFGKKKDSSKTDQHVSRVYREWRDCLAKCINRYMGFNHPYSELHTSSLIGLFQCVFIRQDVRDRVHGLSAADIKCGLKGRYGNKASTPRTGGVWN